jgi:hypothetical protein
MFPIVGTICIGLGALVRKANEVGLRTERIFVGSHTPIFFQSQERLLNGLQANITVGSSPQWAHLQHATLPQP